MTPARRLWQWFLGAARDLPWRQTVARNEKRESRQQRDPYRVWLAEIMLQQTQVTTVIPYYEKFLRRYPTVQKLAAAPADQVLSDWAGLGYYSRARNLHQCARTIVQDYRGQWPTTAAELKKLPGIGDYTAAAIASLAFGENVLAIDGNVARVLSRYGAMAAPLQQAPGDYRAAGQDLLYAPSRGGSAEALIELGALICTPKNPRCGECPLRRTCRAQQMGRVMDFPVKVKKAPPKPRPLALLCLTNAAGDIAVVTRGDGLFGGMMALPGTALSDNERDHALWRRYGARAKVAGHYDHVLSHVRFQVTVYHAAAPRTGNIAWLPRAAAQRAMPTLFRKALILQKAVQKDCSLKDDLIHS